MAAPQGRRAGRPLPGMAARDAALALLSGVLGKGQALNDLLAGAGSGLAPSDRAFARLLATTVLRRRGEIDALLATYLERPLSGRAASVQNVLRLGAAQIVHLETAPHAAVSCAVAQAKAGPGRYDRLVNAVLRRVAAEAAAWRAKPFAPAGNLPDWLWRSWTHAYGEETAAAIAAAHLNEPPLDLTLHPAADGARLRAALDAADPAPRTLRLARTREVTALPGFADGAWWVQDVAAALPARLLLNAVRGAGLAVLDLCAAPGGKTAQLAAAGARVTAVEAAPARAERLRENLARLRLEATVVTADARDWQPEPARLFDAVLLDAPCTSTGTIRRHPDIPWLKRPSDVAAMQSLQRALTDAAMRRLRPGGTLVYAVCSLQPEEGKQQAEWLLRTHPVQRMPVAACEVAGLASPDRDGDVQTLPSFLADAGGMDGFFIARFVRV